ncbi:MAG: hypothetical protein OXR73_06055 [Myxococcales bacterium]|nr:hypothetical protein [Myxococcales bacterium]
MKPRKFWSCTIIAWVAALAGCASESPTGDQAPGGGAGAARVTEVGRVEQALGGSHHRHRVRPIIECVDDNGDGTFTAHWGYNNPGDDPRTIPVGFKNRFLFTAPNQGQPTTFAPGPHEEVLTTVFSVSPWSPGHLWVLDGRFAWASWFTPRCEDEPECQDDSDCDTGDFCNDGQCEPGCASDAECDDDQFCNGEETCDMATGQCMDGTPVVCSGNGDVCDGIETCDEDTDACDGGTPLDCDDNNVCTADACDAVDGCQNTPVADGTSCGDNQVCQTGSCVAVECDMDSDCDDDLFCTGVETCVANSCVPGTPVECPDSDVCDGTDSCDESSDSCQASAPLDCNDNDECTDDSCDPVDGCQNVDISDTCQGSDECQVGSCDPSSGCQVENVPDGMSCDAGEGECIAGVCEPLGPTCTNGGTPVEVVVPHTFRGAYNNAGLVDFGAVPHWKVTGDSYQVRFFNIGNNDGTRAYHTFDLSGLGEILAAEVRIAHPSDSYDSIDAQEIVEVRATSLTSGELEIVPSGVNGGLAPYNLPSSVLQDIYDRLGNGTILQTFTASAASNGMVEVIDLNNAAALADLNAPNNLWTMAVAVQGPPSGLGQFERVFKGSGPANGATELTVLACPPDATVQAPFVDAGHYGLAISNADGSTLQSFHFGSPEQHQSYLTQKQPFGALAQVVRSPYFAFDLSGITTVSKATLRLWVSGPHELNVNSGSYNSPHPSEIFSLYAVENHTASEVINAPFNDTANHTVDEPIWQDLGSGPLIGDFLYTEAIIETGLMLNPNEDQSLDCNDPAPPNPEDAPFCGKWIEISIDPGDVAASAGGLYVLGASVPTFDLGNMAEIEAINGGNIVDGTVLRGRAPAPELHIVP